MSYSYSINNQRCVVRFSSPQEAFCKASYMSGILDSLIISPDYLTMSFYATVVYPLTSVRTHVSRNNSRSVSYEYLPYATCMDLAICLGKQISYLETVGYTLDWIDNHHVVMINNHTFLCLDVDGLCAIAKNGQVTVSRLPDIQSSNAHRHMYLSPELKNATTIPCVLSHRSIYHSLGSLISDSLCNQDLSLGDKSFLLSIVDTRLYWFILRCINPSPESRTLLML